MKLVFKQWVDPGVTIVSFQSVSTSATGFFHDSFISGFIPLHPSDSKDGPWVAPSQSRLYRSRSFVGRGEETSWFPLSIHNHPPKRTLIGLFGAHVLFFFYTCSFFNQSLNPLISQLGSYAQLQGKRMVAFLSFKPPKIPQRNTLQDG